MLTPTRSSEAVVKTRVWGSEAKACSKAPVVGAWQVVFSNHDGMTATERACSPSSASSQKANVSPSCFDFASRSR